MSFRCTFSFIKTIIVRQPQIVKSSFRSSSFFSTFNTLQKRIVKNTFLDYKLCLAKNSFTYRLIAKSYSNISYKTSNAIDTMKYGKKEKETAKVAFMITANMKNQLSSLGYSDSQILSLKPEIAKKIIEDDIKECDYTQWLCTYTKNSPQSNEQKEKETKTNSTDISSIQTLQNNEYKSNTTSSKNAIVVSPDEEKSSNY
ncbi:hypothetical protein WA158_004074 [Blastocystis sp. Blastoise]